MRRATRKFQPGTDDRGGRAPPAAAQRTARRRAIHHPRRIAAAKGAATARVILYLASGTDQADVIEEAQALGYAHYFGDRIFGAVADSDTDAKKAVLERLSEVHGLSGRQFAMFGDGPLEIRETRKRGGVSVGIASDEEAAAGVNLAKRTRLIRAGADLIMADYSSLESLLRLLGFCSDRGKYPDANRPTEAPHRR
jgi:phosphoglycolate phosphatase-like HAD superfamily hydrolase